MNIIIEFQNKQHIRVNAPAIGVLERELGYRVVLLRRESKEIKVELLIFP
jgi:hypothetical protein